ncbi:MAG: carbohydrate-binding domain-containing protein [Lachnospiraceae bacterium]|nr:carbohydrate-binding domain-containing protein [Lachnospiraceae bacterium]
MTAHKNIDKICIAVMLAALVITVLFINGKKLGIESVVDMDSETYMGNEYITANDLNGSWDTEDASVITLNGDMAKLSGNGAYVNGSDIVISNGGKYVITGNLNNGRLIVDAYASSKVWIMLDNVTLYNEEDACIRVEEADKVFITLKEGSTNALSGGEAYSEKAIEDGAEAVIFSRDDLTINGSGSLTVKADYKHGIKANDDLAITGAVVDITSKQDAIHVNEDIALVNADLTISAGDDAVTTEGTIHVDNSDILINECYEGLEAENINVYSGNIEIYSTDDGFNAAGGSTSGFGMQGGIPGGMQGEMPEGQDGMPAEAPDGQSGMPPEMPDGQSGMAPEIPDGQSDNMGGRQETEKESGDVIPYIKIYDGNIRIINSTARDADGLDSNGDVYIYGGNIFISLTGDGSNNAIDYGSESGGVCVIEGGTVIACGSSNMAEGFDAASTQASLLYNISEGVDAGSVISVKTEDGKTIMNAEIPNGFTCAVLSCPEMKVGNRYNIVLGDKSDSITLEEISSSLGDAQSSGFGGPVSFRGMHSENGMSGNGMSGNSMSGNSIRRKRDNAMLSDNVAMGQKGPGGFNHGGGSTAEDSRIGEGSQTSEELQEVSKGLLLTEYDSETLLELALSVVAIAAGIALVSVYRRR